MRYHIILKTCASVSAIALTVLLGTTGCLNTSDADYTGSLSSPGTLSLDRFPVNSGIYPDDDDYDDDDDIDTNVGYYCSIFQECVCSTQTDENYDLCLEAVSYWTEDDCLTILSKAYPSCLNY